ncbi:MULTISPECIES: DUF6468 domain-containing protein [Methylobacterium]|jgi:hypothetical protein|uniref:Protein of unassigned function n=2 Tax=Methylobacterium TaxID=407 RepID=A0A089NLL1_9HYPH|nr:MULTISPECIES: DUF6468 domain-containing protein [Methylobacterium]AIQ88786.1 protein of unassigned function [Methylobacterium oryzae CBMB20]AWV18633.1 glutamyl-tRNA reductase [Methylobacterium sp. XJLW]MBA9062677.1 hypothetical protein [Methylobacterium fujisawaense]MDE4915695.1 DUF6468 domain-containing protein [Methylobacterium sp. 092160098-2]WFS08767.1 DUF6468 domain-containing protein [Methylobacterium sp. 391_Methyba4]
MSLFVTLAADILVAVLLAATIVTSLRLSRRIGQMKGDEAALRQTIGDLMVATGTAERAIAGLRATIDEGDRTLNASLETATIRAAELKLQVEAGEGVITRIGAIVAQMRAVPIRPEPSPEPRPAPEIPPERRPEQAGPNGERLGVAAAAALAMSERALARVRARAA